MATFKNTKNILGANATYAAYKKLTAQNVVTYQYVAKKQFNIEGNQLGNNGIYSLLLHNSNTE